MPGLNFNILLKLVYQLESVLRIGEQLLTKICAVELAVTLSEIRVTVNVTVYGEFAVELKVCVAICVAAVFEEDPVSPKFHE